MQKLVNWAFRLSPLALAAYWLAMFVGTHYPVELNQPSIPSFDKVLHCTAYAGLAMLLAAAWNLKTSLFAKHYLMIAAILAVYGAIDEALQMIPVVQRDGDVIDWLFDLGGITVGLLIYAGMAQLARRRGMRIERRERGRL